ncbi:Tn3 family transposase [Spirillospora sp. NPDC050679]
MRSSCDRQCYLPGEQLWPAPVDEELAALRARCQRLHQHIHATRAELPGHTPQVIVPGIASDRDQLGVLPASLARGAAARVRRIPAGSPHHDYGPTRRFRLGLNAVVLLNSLYIDAAVKQLAADGLSVTDELLARLSPLQYDHINFFGRYAFTRSLTPGLRQLRGPYSDDETDNDEDG